MPIQLSDILFKFSVKTGAAGNSTAGTASGSLGKYISTTGWTGGSLHDLFDVISGAENAASTVDYRCLFVHNNHATNTYLNVVLWMPSQVTGGADATLGVDTTAASVIGDSNAQAVEVATETSAPAGISFSSPVSKATGLSLGDIDPGYCKAFWIRRSATNSGALNNDGVTINIEGDTEA